MLVEVRLKTDRLSLVDEWQTVVFISMTPDTRRNRVVHGVRRHEDMTTPL